MTKALSIITRYSIYALPIFTPLARASVQGWGIATIHIVTLIALTAFLLEKAWTWEWEWISTPLDKPIFILIILPVVAKQRFIRLRRIPPSGPCSPRRSRRSYWG